MLLNLLNSLLLLGLPGMSTAKLAIGVQPGGIDEAQNELIQKSCGLINSAKPRGKVLRGENVTKSQMNEDAPWVVSIHYEDENPRKQQKMQCSGVLISPRHVLTAAHCQAFEQSGTRCAFDNTFRHNVSFAKRDVSRYRVRTGSVCGHRDCTDGVTHHVKRIIYPSSFTDGEGPKSYCLSYKGDTEDIAIYELTEEVKGAHYPCLAQVGEQQGAPLTNYGYGRAHGPNPNLEPYILKRHLVQYVSCSVWGDWEELANRRECIKHIPSNNSIACQGDSGGPVISSLDGRAYSVGVLTAGSSCDTATDNADKHTGAFKVEGDTMTSVPHYLNWICKWSGICPEKSQPGRDERPTEVWDRNDTLKNKTDSILN